MATFKPGLVGSCAFGVAEAMFIVWCMKSPDVQEWMMKRTFNLDEDLE